MDDETENIENPLEEEATDDPVVEEDNAEDHGEENQEEEGGEPAAEEVDGEGEQEETVEDNEEAPTEETGDPEDVPEVENVDETNPDDVELEIRDEDDGRPASSLSKKVKVWQMVHIYKVYLKFNPNHFQFALNLVCKEISRRE